MTDDIITTDKDTTVASFTTDSSQELLIKTDEEKLEELLSTEEAIENISSAAFHRVGMLLVSIKETESYKLIREKPLDGKYSFVTFEEYCDARFGYSLSYVGDLMRGALALDEMMKTVAQGGIASGDTFLGDTFTLPKLEAHVRPLLALDTPQERINVWSKAAQDNKTVTRSLLEKEVKAYKRNRDRDYQTIEEWKADPWPIKESNKTFNKQTDKNIEWAQWSWNPVTGCDHGCSYCYARDIQNHYYPEKNFTPSRHPSRLSAPVNTKVPVEAETDVAFKNVFLGSMTDLFGRWLPKEWIDEVIDVCVDNPQWNFLTLTKFPNRYKEFYFPENMWLGTSVDCQARVANAETAFEEVVGTKWLSVEPLLEPLKFSKLHLFDWVVIGGASRSSQTPEWIPPFDWFVDLFYQAREANCKIYVKDNLPYFNEQYRLREFPWCQYEEKSLPESFKYMKSIK